MTDEECLYRVLAMAIDTDGNISISNSSTSYVQHIGFTNTNIKLIEWIVDNFGGKIPPVTEHDNPNHKDSYGWYLTGHNSYKILKKIRPFLIAKQEQAELAIELFEKVSKWKTGRAKMVLWKKKLQEELYQKCKALNMKGKPDEEPEPPKLIKKTTKVTETLEEYVL